MINASVLSKNKVITQSQGNIVSDMDGELVMLSIEKGNYYNLGVLGGEIWSLIEKPIIISDLLEKLISQYDVSQQDCEEEVLSFLSDLYNEGLIILPAEI
ncbi:MULTISPECIES: lasso peptide biosynthesis PqqD family chaperone [Peribacillus]|uniref:lasso peptide biosynthesis PqqD family chaperone n=1 Tax=Peribacillus TaxID=2675229 RepID=UPI001F4DDCF8|nr:MULTISPECIES: lasso peptide biosynthesis PqqD family chaperone [unclassified Peribacillus]MCK1982997.1 lasso peptide biosynthesis PqqD family chaperone [Peribacillus sp. Aquil_B1]MCK2011178.1 lasso peptide biosynthesis PqqD family chaperone [Peribacillus sp. Aquil_B8]